LFIFIALLRISFFVDDKPLAETCETETEQTGKQKQKLKQETETEKQHVTEQKQPEPLLFESSLI